VGRPLTDTRVVFYGAGASGAGCALALRAAMRAAGVPESELSHRVMCLDSNGLIVKDRSGLEGAKREIAADPSQVKDWPRSADGAVRLPDVVRQFAPHVLVGASGQPGAFTESIIRDMLLGTTRPIVLALSNPTSRVEVTPAEVIHWTNGAGVMGTGSPFPPVEFQGTRRRIGQGNNVFIFPGVGLGATAVEARWLPDEAFTAAADALVAFTSECAAIDDAIYPPLSSLRDVSRRVAIAVAQSLVATGAAPPISDDEIERRVEMSIWTPEYLPYRPA